MKTDDLINALAADAAAPALPMARAWALALGTAVATAALVFFVTLGPRPDIAAAAGTVRFLFKPVAMGVLAITAFAVLSALSRPAAASLRAMSVLALAPSLLLVAVMLELLVVPSGRWGVRLIGSNAVLCLTYIPLIGIAPLVAFLLALRHGAPTRPGFAGAVAGAAAGGIAATFYAVHCPDNSPLFIATWYSVAILGLAFLGALAAPRVSRW